MRQEVRCQSTIHVLFSCVQLMLFLPPSFHFLYFLWQAQNSGKKACFQSKFYPTLHLSLSAMGGSPSHPDFPGPACSSAVHSDHRFILQTERTMKLPGTGLWGQLSSANCLSEQGKPNSCQRSRTLGGLLRKVYGSWGL